MNKKTTVKLFRIMKICASQVIIALVLCGVSIAHESEGQILDKEISLSLSDTPLEQVLEKLTEIAQIKFAYGRDQIDVKERLSIHAERLPLKAILEELFTKRGIKFIVHENESVISLKKVGAKIESVIDDPDSGNKSASVIPQIEISGTIKDSNNQPIAGANIIVRGSTNGTTSDMDGRYKILADTEDVLVFSFIGYAKQEVVIRTQTEIDVVMVEDNQNLNTVIINAGYYKIDNKEQTGNISRVVSKDISTQPVLNPMQSIQGRMAGVQVTQFSGIPGDGFTIRIRGINSVRGLLANEPLYIVDGVPFSTESLLNAGGNITSRPNPLNSINPQDIESIEVLKDADATAIYGSRGANGVVLITTKKAKIGKTRFDVNIYSGVGQVANQMSMLNTQQYLGMRREAFKNDGVAPTTANAPDLLLWDTTRYTNWQKTLVGGTAKITNGQASISGGDSRTNFLLGTGYYRQSTVFPGDYSYQKGSVRLAVGHRTADDKLSINLTGNFASDNNNLPASDLTNLAATLIPNTPSIYDGNGALNWQNGTFTNPYGEMRKKYESSSQTLIANSNISYEVIPGLSLRANLGYSMIFTKERNVTPIAAQNPANNPLGTVLLTNGSVSTWVAEPQVDYEKRLGEGKISALGGLTFQQTIRDRTGLIAGGYTNDSQLENIAAAATLTSLSTDYSEYKYTAVYGRINYNFKERYIINLTGRRDGSSRFGPNKRFANFGAIGAGWIFSNENFIKSTSGWLSFGKLRGSIGVTGSDQIGDYQYLDTHTSTQFVYQGGKGVLPSRLVNPDFGWEQNNKMEGGLDLGFLHDRLTFSLSYYYNRSSNQLVGYSLPAMTGFSSIQNNLPATIQNTGLEMVVNLAVIEGEKFKWNTSINVTFPRNQLVDYPNIESSTYSNTYQVGKSLFIQKKLHSLGVDPTTGIYTYEDADQNGSINTTLDAQFLKERSVNFFGGFQNTFTYKGFELQFLLQFTKQTGLNYLATTTIAPGARGNQPTVVLDRWQHPGDLTDIQRFSQAGTAVTAYQFGFIFGDAPIADASYVRLQNLSLGWTMPDRWSNKIKSENVRIYFQGQNLFTITDYQGSDPETQSVRVLPPLRVITFGVQLTF